MGLHLKRKLGFVDQDQYNEGEQAHPLLSRFQFYERHSFEHFTAPAADIINAVKHFDMYQDPYIKVLMTIRTLPSTLLPKSTQSDQTPADPFSFETFTVLHESDHCLCMGLVGQFWRPSMGIVPLNTKEDFQHFSDPSCAKLLLRFSVQEEGRGLRTLNTETCVYCPTLRTYWLFTGYWLAIRLASGFIRKRTLLGIKRALDPQSTMQS